MLKVKNASKKFNDDAKLPTVQKTGALAPKNAASAKVIAAQKPANKKATKPATKVAATADTMVSLRMPKDTEELDRWVRTPVIAGHKYRHWFDKTKPGISVKVDKKGILVTLPRSEAAHRGMLDYIEA